MEERGVSLHCVAQGVGDIAMRKVSSVILFCVFLVFSHAFAGEQPLEIKGIYYGSHMFGSKRIISAMEGLLDTTEINTVIIDKKDDHGKEFTGSEFKRFTQSLIDHRAFIMCRVVLLRDATYAEGAGKKFALKSKAKPENNWKDRKGFMYLDPVFEEVVDYYIGVTLRAIEHGCPFINFDYVRLPSPRDGNTRDTKYPPLPFPPEKYKQEFKVQAKIKRDVVKTFVERLVLGIRTKYPDVPLAASIFGYACYGSEPDVGQYLDDFVSRGLIIACMAYPSHYSCNDEAPDPNKIPEVIYRKTILKGRAYLAERGLSATFIPWIQGFDYPNINGCGLEELNGKMVGRPGKPGDKTLYASDPKHFRKQITALNKDGIYSWLVWPSVMAFENKNLYLKKP